MKDESFNLTVETLAGMIDQTFLKPFGTQDDIERLCEEALRYGFAAVIVNPSEVALCASLLAGSKTKVGTVIGFPLGQTTTACKSFETKDAIAKGASEIDMVINIRALQNGHLDVVKREIDDMVAICNPIQVISKVIIETCYITDIEKEMACRIAKAAGADFVKTSTGFGIAGATESDIRLMRRIVGEEMGVKASGGIRDLETAWTMIKAGATRIGTSSGVTIIETLSLYDGMRYSMCEMLEIHGTEEKLSPEALDDLAEYVLAL